MRTVNAASHEHYTEVLGTVQARNPYHRCLWPDATTPRTGCNYRFVREFGVSRIMRQWWHY